jgi:hypothetical protein
MRTVRPIFPRNANSSNNYVDFLRQFGELRSGLNSNPEYARSLCRGEESISGCANCERASLNPPQTFSDGIYLLCLLFSNELQSNVQRLGTHPARLGREPLDAFKEARDAVANFRVKIDADEYSHLCDCVVTASRRS